ncbi:MAG: response regulator [Pyrinomonadaceae bacterium]
MKRAKDLFLVVEDFEDSRFMMRRLLEMAGYNVLEASDGEQAVKMAVEARPVLILMDLSLPKLDGLAATRLIRQKKGLKAVPIVAVSAHDSPQSRSEALEAGCDEYVTKPIDFDHLTKLLQRFLALRKSSRAQSPSNVLESP